MSNKWESAAETALQEYAESVNKFVKLELDDNDFTEWLINRYNALDTNVNFRDYIQDELIELADNNTHYIIEDIYSNIMELIDADILAEYETEIYQYITEMFYCYISIGYDWDDIKCDMNIYVEKYSDDINYSIACSEVLEKYISTKPHDNSELYSYLAEGEMVYQKLDKTIYNFREAIDAITEYDANKITFSFEHDYEYYHLLDSNNELLLKKLIKKFQSITKVIDYDSLKIKKYKSLKHMCKSIKVPHCKTYVDDDTICVENSLGYKYHLDYDEISQILSTKEYRREIINDIFDAFFKREMNDVNLNSIDITKIWISFDDSITSGNCKYGTREFCNSNNIDTLKIGGIRADLLLELRNDIFTKRAIKYKYLHMRG